MSGYPAHEMEPEVGRVRCLPGLTLPEGDEECESIVDEEGNLIFYCVGQSSAALELVRRWNAFEVAGRAQEKGTPRPWMVRSGCVYAANPRGWEDGGDEPYVRIAYMDRDEPATSPTERDENAEIIADSVNTFETLLRLAHGLAMSMLPSSDGRVSCLVNAVLGVTEPRVSGLAKDRTCSLCRVSFTASCDHPPPVFDEGTAVTETCPSCLLCPRCHGTAKAAGKAQADAQRYPDPEGGR